jgi:hypothetical protein
VAAVDADDAGLVLVNGVSAKRAGIVVVVVVVVVVVRLFAVFD